MSEELISAVLDTNVLASGFGNPHGIPAELLRRWRDGHFRLIMSEPILTEFTRTQEKPYFTMRLTRQQRRNNLALLREEALVTPLTVQVHDVATHPEDDLILATAASARADYLVTGDRRLQDLGAYQATVIVSPRRFLELLPDE